MSVLTAIQRACPKLGLEVPVAVFSSTERELVELAEIANDAAEEISKAYDWQALKTVATLTGDASTEDFSQPTDYHRQLLKTKLWSSTRPGSPLEHVPDADTWLGIVTSGLTVSTGQWTIYGGFVRIRPAMALAETAKFFYITKNRVDPASGSNKEFFTLDDDVFLLDESVLRKAIIWKWKESKGLPYAEAMADYEIALAEAIGRDKGSKILIVGMQRLPSGWEYAYPGVVVP